MSRPIYEHGGSRDNERTIALIKPCAFRRGLVGQIISEIEHAPLAAGSIRIDMAVLLKPGLWTPNLFYAEHAAKPFFAPLVHHMNSGPTLAMVLEGDDVISRWRFMVGPVGSTHPEQIRGRWSAGDPPYMNLVHGSDSPASFERERALLGFM